MEVQVGLWAQSFHTSAILATFSMDQLTEHVKVIDSGLVKLLHVVSVLYEVDLGGPIIGVCQTNSCSTNKAYYWSTMSSYRLTDFSVKLMLSRSLI